MESSALISDCGRFRYRLGRRWGDGPFLLFILLNPSTADAEKLDPTLRRCIGFAQTHHFNALEVVNLFAFRATYPRDLKAAGYPVGPDNDLHIAAALSGACSVCVGWGDRARGLARPADVLALVGRSGHGVQCLAVTVHGLPGHPLMLSSSCRLAPYRSLSRAVP